MRRAERHEAKLAGKTRYFTGKPCKYGHIAERYVSTKTCVVCARKNVAEWYKENLCRVLAYNAKWMAENPEKVKAHRRSHRARNPEKVFLLSMQRKRDLKERIPKWANREAIRQVYADAREFRAAGLDVCVDHIIPIRGELVSGLHVENNLRVCLSSVNQLKSNSFEI